MSDTREFDAVIMGAGVSGLTAGVRLAERGTRVAVLEKGEDESYPCNTRMTGGAFHVAFHDVNDEEAVLLRILGGALKQMGGVLLCGARARSLSMKGGRCCGVEAEVRGERVAIQAGSVVVCDGGFQANHALQRGARNGAYGAPGAPRTTSVHRAWPIHKKPFYAVRLCAGIT